MCTVCIWADSDIATVSARNMDWFMEMDTKLWVLPAGISHVGCDPEDPNPLTWTSKYGSVITSVYDVASADGVNEKGLSAHALWLVEAKYGPRDTSKPGLALSYWLQYYLDNFATVAEALEDYAAHPFQLVAIDLLGRPATIHMQIADEGGDVAVLEVINGKIIIHHGPEYTVLTNSPTFDEQLSNLREYHGFGGSKPLPGTSLAKDRFVRASYYRKNIPEPKDLTHGIAQMFAILRNAAQPFAVDDPDDPSVSTTLWTTVVDHTNLVYYYQPMDSPYLIWLDLKKQDFSVGAPVLSLNLGDMARRIGEQSDSLVEMPLFKFALPLDNPVSEAKPQA